MSYYCETRDQAREMYGDEYSEGEELVLTFPKTFIQDHAGRELPHGVLVRETQQRVTLSVTQKELGEIGSDADYYATFTGYDYQENKWICEAAKRTLKAIARQTHEVPKMTFSERYMNLSGVGRILYTKAECACGWNLAGHGESRIRSAASKHQEDDHS